MIFTSGQPPVDIPTDLTIWEWLFDSQYSPLQSSTPGELGAFVDAATKEQIRYDTVRDYTVQIATALVKDHGLRPGDTVAIISTNTVWYPVAVLAALRAGGVVAGASCGLNVEEMTHALKSVDAKFLLTVPSALSAATTAAAAVGIPSEGIMLLQGQDGTHTTLRDLMETGSRYGAEDQASALVGLPAGKSNRDVCALLGFSSGTTGIPKTVMASHHNVIAQATLMKHVADPRQTKYLAVLPTVYLGGLVHLLLVPLIRNSSAFMLPSFTVESLLNTIVEYQITDLVLVPPMLLRLAQDPVVLKYDLAHVRSLTSSTAPISATTVQGLNARFPSAGFRQAYGMTESCGTIARHPPGIHSYEYAQRAGVLHPNTELKVLDPQSGQELGPDKPGEILTRGPQIAMGYWGDEKATREAFLKDGWLRTGDVGYVDREGWLVISDRVKEMITVNGMAVSPVELEELLRAHPDVLDVAVVAVPNESSGQRPKAFVELRAEAREQLKDGPDEVRRVGLDIMEYVRCNKECNKWVVEVEFLPSIEKRLTGKIHRYVLRESEGSSLNGERLIVRAH